MFCDRGYLKQVGAAYRLALAREALFSDLAKRPWSGDRCAKLRVLRRLESETIALLGSILDSADVADIVSRSATASVRSQARALAGRRWIEIIEKLCVELAMRVAQIEHLERLAPAGEIQQLARVTAHHIALQMFMRLELAGRGRESIQPALALIPADPLPLAAAAG